MRPTRQLLNLIALNPSIFLYDVFKQRNQRCYCGLFWYKSDVVCRYLMGSPNLLANTQVKCLLFDTDSSLQFMGKHTVSFRDNLFVLYYNILSCSASVVIWILSLDTQMLSCSCYSCSYVLKALVSNSIVFWSFSTISSWTHFFNSGLYLASIVFWINRKQERLKNCLTFWLFTFLLFKTKLGYIITRITLE